MNSRVRNGVLMVFFCVVFLLACTKSETQEKKLWEHWKMSNELEQAKVDHQIWNSLLQNYVETGPTNTRVNYSSVSSEDKIKLKIYLSYLGELGVTKLSRQEQLAYWINLYNAEIWDIVLSYYPVKSIHKIHISPGNFSKGPWDKKFIQIEGVAITLNDIENRILRPIWGDDRIHYVLNKGAVGSPSIQNFAITSDNVEDLLQQARIDFINSSRAVRVKNNTVVLSKLYKDYLYDFAEDESSLISYIAQYYVGEYTSIIQNFDANTQKIKYNFDWRLNE